MAIKIQNTSNVEFDGVKCVVYGGAGVGKTRLCSTAPSPIIISAEKGLLSLKDLSVDFIEITSLEELNDAYRFVKTSNDAKKYDTVSLDSLSEIGEVLVEKIKPDYKDQRQAYGALADKMMPMLRRFRDLEGKHTLFTCKMEMFKDEEAGNVKEILLLPGQVLPKQVPYMVDELFSLSIDRKGIGNLQTKPDRNRFCKDRSGALEDIEKGNPEINMTEIFKKITKKMTGGTMK